MASEPEPIQPVDAITSTAARDAYKTVILTWARLGWAQVGSICTWAKDRGMPDAPC